MRISEHVHNGFLKIIVKTNSPKTDVVGFDEARNALKVNVSAPPVDGRANKEVIKFFSKTLKKKVEIKSGKTSKEKLLKVF